MYTREQRIEDLRARLEVYRKRRHEADFERVSLQLQLNQAMHHLLQILEGDDREKAIEETRAWLKRFWQRKGGYDLRARLACEIIPAVMKRFAEECDGDFPEEIEI